jgi:rod shape-determining protein MreC
VLLSILLLAIERQSDRLEGVRSFLSVIVYPIQSLVSLPIEVTDQTVQFFISYQGLKKENVILKKQAQLHKTSLLKLKNLEKENIRLRALMNKSYTLSEHVLAAELIGATHFPYEHIVLVDKGTHFGVAKRQPVLDTNGIVGQVIREYPLSAEIMLITDPSHAIAVEVNNNGLRTIAFGNGQYNQLKLPFLPNDADIFIGDLLISSGLDGTFPRGYPVAIVTEIKQSNKAFSYILAEPVAQLDKIREVLIVLNEPKSIPLTATQEITKNQSEQIKNPTENKIDANHAE